MWQVWGRIKFVEGKMSKYKLIILAVVALLTGFLLGYILGNGKADSTAKAERISQAVEKAVSQDKEVKDFGKPALIYFYANECSSCQKFKPTWLTLKRKYKNKFNFVEVDVDDAVNAPLCIEFMVNIIPAVHIEDAPFRNRAFINPMEYHFLPRMEDGLTRYLEMREILKKGAV